MNVVAVVHWQQGKCIAVSESTVEVVSYADIGNRIRAQKGTVCIYHETQVQAHVPSDSFHMRMCMSEATRCCIEWAASPLQEWSKRHRRQYVHGALEEAQALLEVYRDYESFRGNGAKGS